MAENPVLAMILDGISLLTEEEDIKAVLEAARKKQQDREPYRQFTEEEKLALSRGNSQAMILMNEEVYDFSRVPEKIFIKAKKWFNAPKPSTDTRGEYAKAYHQWRVWNWKKYKYYKGHMIRDKATGQAALSSSAKDEDEVEIEGREIEGEEIEGEESDDDESDDDEAVAALVEAVEVK